MIDGHGDDTFRYEGIGMNFSSNIFPQADLAALETHLSCQLHRIHSYPEPTPDSLARHIAQAEGVDEACVLVTNGATEAIHLIAQTFRALDTFTIVHPTFSEYADASFANGLHEVGQGALGWLCSPNNPTGLVTPTEDILAMAAQHQQLVVDLAYEDYTLAPMPTAQHLLERGNIIALHSMTKQYAVPGLRLGYVVAPPVLIEQLRRHYHPWAVNALAIEAGRWLVANATRPCVDLPTYLAETQRLRQMLNAIDGISAADTQTNFLLCAIEPTTAAELKDFLATHFGILIRNAANFRGLTPHHFRIATQTPAENEALVAAIQLFLQQR